MERAQQNVNDQKEKVDDLTSAATAADTVKSTKTALEDKLFEMNKGDTAALDMQGGKEGQSKKQRRTSKSSQRTPTRRRSRRRSAARLPPSPSLPAILRAQDTAIATINQTDRGFTVKISITNEQAKKVKVGDTAELRQLLGRRDRNARDHRQRPAEPAEKPPADL